MNIRTTIYLVFFYCILTISVSAQNFLGFQGSNYAGVYGIANQPASVADSKLLFDIGIGGTSTTMWNNYLGINGLKLLSKGFNNPLKGGNWRDDFFNRNNKYPKKYYGYLNSDIHFPLSFMTNISPRIGIGFTYRNRSIANVDNMDGFLLYSLYLRNQYAAFRNRPIDADNMRISYMNYNEYAFTYGQVLYNKEQHLVKAGFTLKLIQGFSGGYLFADDMKMMFTSDTTMDVNQMNVRIASAQTIPTPNINFLPHKHIDSLFANPFPTGFGADWGVVYEYRPEYDKYYYEAEGKRYFKRYLNQYKFRAGISMTDVGYVDFKKATTQNLSGVDVKNLPANFNQPTNANGLGNFLSNNFQSSNLHEDTTLRMFLPTAVSAQFDYQINPKFYIAAELYYALKRQNVANSVHGVSNFSVTPRYENRHFGLAIPISLDNNFTPQVGFAFRGPTFPVLPVHFMIGSNNLYGALFKRNEKGFDIHFALHIPFAYRLRDKDFDGVLNKKDACPETPGFARFKGCPDTDKDGVSDNVDECMTIPGKISMKGCPDTDNDNIPDQADRCPEEKGSPKNMGCPDFDRDGIVDIDDKCPEDKGLKELQGCPDTDKDGVVDNLDECPNVPGRIATKGCPDSDRDGIYDAKDKCPKKAGPEYTQGCPDTDGDIIPDDEDKCPNDFGGNTAKGCPDTDEDGIADKEDRCPAEAGTLANKGCPVVAKVTENKPGNVQNAPIENTQVADDKLIPISFDQIQIDADRDGVIDDEDPCPNVFGTKENKGCPGLVIGEVIPQAYLNAPITQENEDFIKYAFEAIEFEVGKSNLTQECLPLMEDLAFYLQLNPHIRLRIKGFTDNQGSEVSNIVLGQQRAESVKIYLVQNGIAKNRLETVTLGELQPKADNNTEKGRQRNRRVEAEILK